MGTGAAAGTWAAAGRAWARGARWMDGWDGMAWWYSGQDGRTWGPERMHHPNESIKEGFQSREPVVGAAAAARGRRGVQHAVLCCADMAQRAFRGPRPRARRRASREGQAERRLGAPRAGRLPMPARPGLLASAELPLRARWDACKGWDQLTPWPQGSAPSSCRRWPRGWGRGRT